MRSKNRSISPGETTESENYISKNKLSPLEKSQGLTKSQESLKIQDRNKENQGLTADRKLVTRDSGNINACEDESLSIDNVKNLRVLKNPLHRKSSNITNDSGRSSVSDLVENDIDTHSEYTGVQTCPSLPVKSVSCSIDNGRRESLTVIDSTGHLTLPSPLDCVSNPHFHEVNGESEVRTFEKHRCQSAHSLPTSHSSDTDSPIPTTSRPLNGEALSTKRHAPKIIYSKSEDSSVNHRLFSNRSPHTSPTASPRLRRQPTMETRRISLSDSGDGYMQLNQYKLKDEIGKVCDKFPCLLYLLENPLVTLYRMTKF